MPETKSSLGVPIAIVIAGALIAGAVLYTRSSPSTGVTPGEPQEITLRAVSSSEHILGNPGAKVVIVEYSDPECPFCKSFHGTMKRIMSEYGGNGSVAWVYRHFPIPELHAKAQAEAEAMECAAEIGGNTAFWKFADRLYEITPSNDGLDAAELPKIAAFAGLDAAAFAKCTAERRTKAKVDADHADGVAAGARGTPYSVILTKNGDKVPLEGALPYDDMRQIIETLVK